jgi:hypothetical protein
MTTVSTSIKKDYHSYVHWVNEQGIVHREDGPARIWVDGNKEWIINGKRHRLNGPAYEYSNGLENWWVNGYWVHVY